MGSLVAAVASAVDIKHRQGEHRIRIDDIDPPREMAGSAARILQAIKDFAIPIDGPVLRQSERMTSYQDALFKLVKLAPVFACTCSRKSLLNGQLCITDCHKHLLSVEVPIARQLRSLKGDAAIRLNTKALEQSLTVQDAIQSTQFIDDVSTLGTPALWRKDGCVSYLLATAIDDSQTITDVVRGADLWPETPLQQLVMELLNRPVPNWAHVPCATNDENHKLGKQTRAPSIHQGDSLALLQNAWQFLGQKTQDCGSLEEFWHNAARNWVRESVPQVLTQRID